MIGSEQPKHARVVPPEMQELLAAHHPQPALVTHASWFVNKVRWSAALAIAHGGGGATALGGHCSAGCYRRIGIRAPPYMPHRLVNVLQYASVRKAVSLIWRRPHPDWPSQSRLRNLCSCTSRHGGIRCGRRRWSYSPSSSAEKFGIRYWANNRAIGAERLPSPICSRGASSRVPIRYLRRIIALNNCWRCSEANEALARKGDRHVLSVIAFRGVLIPW